MTEFEAECKNLRDTRGDMSKHSKILKMMDYMKVYYDNLKDKQGITDYFLRVDKKEITKLEDVFRMIKPNSTATSFREYLHHDDNQSKSMDKKSIQRAVK